MSLHSGLMNTWVVCYVTGAAAFTDPNKQKIVTMMGLNLASTALSLLSFSSNRSLAAWVVKHDVNDDFTVGIPACCMTAFGRFLPLGALHSGHSVQKTE